MPSPPLISLRPVLKLDSAANELHPRLLCQRRVRFQWQWRKLGEIIEDLSDALDARNWADRMRLQAKGASGSLRRPEEPARSSATCSRVKSSSTQTTSCRAPAIVS